MLAYIETYSRTYKYIYTYTVCGYTDSIFCNLAAQACLHTQIEKTDGAEIMPRSAILFPGSICSAWHSADIATVATLGLNAIRRP